MSPAEPTASHEPNLDVLAERDRIARDLHDTVIGRIFGTGMVLRGLASWAEDPDLRRRLETSVEELDAVIDEIRSTIYSLGPQPGWRSDTGGRLLAVAAQQIELLGFAPTVELDGPIDELPAAVADELLATVREVLTNTVKHARATSVTITVAATGRGVELVVRDDGIGFAPHDEPATRSPKGRGLANIEARARALGGAATVTSRPGQGTIVTWSVPCSGPDAADGDEATELDYLAILSEPGGADAGAGGNGGNGSQSLLDKR